MFKTFRMFNRLQLNISNFFFFFGDFHRCELPSSSGSTFIGNHLEVGQIQLLVLCCAVAKAETFVGGNLNDLDRFCPSKKQQCDEQHAEERTPPLKIPVEKSLGNWGWAVRPLVSQIPAHKCINPFVNGCWKQRLHLWCNGVYLSTAVDPRVLAKTYDWHDSSYHVSMPREIFFLQFLPFFNPGKRLRNLDIIKCKSLYVQITIWGEFCESSEKERIQSATQNLLRERDSVMLFAHAELVIFKQELTILFREEHLFPDDRIQIRQINKIQQPYARYMMIYIYIYIIHMSAWIPVCLGI